MKKIKLSLVLLVVVAFVVGIVILVTTKRADDAIDLKKSSVKEQTVEKNIKEKIENAPNSSFCVQAYNDILGEINLFFKDEPTNKKTYTTELQRVYTDKFVQQAMYVFEHNLWRSSDIATIHREYKNCMSFSPDNPDLPVIMTILNDYDKLLNYDNRVTAACKQRPQKSLFSDEDWNIVETDRLLNSVPAISTKAKNSPIYSKTRRNEVEKKLKTAHRHFVDERLNRAEQIAKKSISHNEWMEMGKQLDKNFKTYGRKWGDNDQVVDWARRLQNMEKYTVDF